MDPKSRKSPVLRIRLQRIDKVSPKSYAFKKLQKQDRKSPAKEYFVVQDIKDIAVMNGTVRCLVKWQNFPSSQNTWEPLKNLKYCESLIRDCEKRIIRRLNLQYFKKQRVYGFEFKGQPEKILDVFRFSGVRVAKVKFIESEEINFILFDEVKEKYPQLLLNFYLSTALIWSTRNSGSFSFILTYLSKILLLILQLFLKRYFCWGDDFSKDYLTTHFGMQYEVWCEI